MAHLKFSTAEEEKEFYENLPQSKMVLLSYILPNGPVNYVSITEVIASSFSHRIKKHRPGVQSSISSRSLALLSSWQRHIEDLMNVPAKFGEFLKSFVVWAYTGRVLLHSLRHFQLWLYGQFLGSPGFMNAVLRDFSLSEDSENILSPNDHLTKVTATDVRQCWATFNFETDNQDDIVMAVVWENKKMLKFMIDVFAHKALHREDFKGNEEVDEVKKLLGGRDQVAMQAMRVIGQREERRTKTPPWHPENLGEYFVDENMSEERLESYCGIERE